MNLQARPSLIEEVVGEELVLLPIDPETFYRLDAPGRLVLACVRDGGSLQDAVAALGERYGVEPALAEADARALLDDLLRLGLLQRT